MLNKIILTVALLFSFSVFAAENQPAYTPTPQKIVVSQQKPDIILMLPSNPTTGFSWTVLKYDHPLVELVSHRFVAPKDKKLMGAPGYEIWAFKAKKAHYRVAQVGHIVMQYRRPWTKEGASNKTFIIVVKAKSIRRSND